LALKIILACQLVTETGIGWFDREAGAAAKLVRSPPPMAPPRARGPGL
jgi:hypothetical protein